MADQKQEFIEGMSKYLCELEAAQKLPGKDLPKITAKERKEIGLPEICNEIVPPPFYVRIPACTKSGRHQCFDI